MPLNVLIVDDCDLVRGVMVKTLSLAGVPVAQLHEAANGSEALDIIDENWIDLILADLNMPVMDGVEMIDRLYSHGLLKRIPVVVISTERNTTRIEELEKKGVTAYLRKPFTPEAMRDTIWSVVGRVDEEDHLDALRDAFNEAVEGFVLMAAEESDTWAVLVDMQVEGSGCAQASLSFRGPRSGVLRAAAPRELLREMAANVLGIDAEEAAAAASSPHALKELVNLTAGRLVTALTDEHAACELSAPVFSDISPADWSEEPGRWILGFSVEGYPLVLALDVRTCDA